MKFKTISILCILALGLGVSCEDYDEYIEDFEYSIVYFGTQRPLRTIVSYDEMQFKVGVAMGGKRSNPQQETAQFIIDPSLLDDAVEDGASTFTLLPENYYTLSNANTMVFPEGRFIGDVTVSLDREAFTSDSLATENTYALPFQLTGTSLDSIAGAGRDYTIVVVKYISEYHGTYYQKGLQTEVDSMGTTLEEVEYNETDLIENGTWDLGTIDRNTVQTSGIGMRGNGSLILEVSESDNSVDISAGSGNVVDLEGSGEYDEENRRFYLDYDYTFQNRFYQVQDTLILRRPPEEDLSFEEW